MYCKILRHGTSILGGVLDVSSAWAHRCMYNCRLLDSPPGVVVLSAKDAAMKPASVSLTRRFCVVCVSFPAPLRHTWFESPADCRSSLLSAHLKTTLCLSQSFHGCAHSHLMLHITPDTHISPPTQSHRCPTPSPTSTQIFHHFDSQMAQMKQYQFLISSLSFHFLTLKRHFDRFWFPR